jgi:putative DNA primase/helicase
MQAAELARNRWHNLLAHFGIDQKSLTGKHSPCPVCGGRDRFRFDDQDGRGTFFCSHCGSGDGFALLGLVKGWAFKESAAEVERIAGMVTASAPKHRLGDAEKLAACKRIWSESKAIVVGDPVHAYLLRRTGIENVPACIRFHPDLPYRHNDGAITRHPAMIAKIQDIDGNGVALHRTYLTTDGHKANVPTVKKVIGSLPPGAAVRLMPASGRMGIAEGIETAFAASMIFGMPVWAAVSAIGLERWTPPAVTEHLAVFGDNDTSHTGQAAAFSLAKRMHNADVTAEVHIPTCPGTDWADPQLNF